MSDMKKPYLNQAKVHTTDEKRNTLPYSSNPVLYSLLLSRYTHPEETFVISTERSETHEGL